LSPPSRSWTYLGGEVLRGFVHLQPPCGQPARDRRQAADPAQSGGTPFNREGASSRGLATAGCARL
jgi:hypothetical protein